MSEIELELHHFRLAIELAMRGARPHVICALTNLKHDRVVTIYEDINGQKPKQGRTPEQLDSFIRSKPINLACSFFAVKFLQGIQLGIEQASSIMIAYDATADVFNTNGKPLIPFDRAWNIVQSLSYLKSHHLTRCGFCHSKYLMQTATLKNDMKQCPACSLIKGQLQEQKVSNQPSLSQ